MIAAIAFLVLIGIGVVVLAIHIAGDDCIGADLRTPGAPYRPLAIYMMFLMGIAATLCWALAFFLFMTWPR